MALPEARYPRNAQVGAFYEAVLDRLRAVPDVQSAALVSHLPVASFAFNFAVTIEARPPAQVQDLPTAYYRVASADYFQTLGIPQIAGRGFSDRDRAGAVRVGVINQVMARRFWPGENAIGKRFIPDDGEPTPIEVVGTVGDVRHFGLSGDFEPEFFVPYQQVVPLYWQFANKTLNVVIRPRGTSSNALNAARDAIRSIDPEVPIYRITTLERIMLNSMALPRIYKGLLTAFALIALSLAVIGIYGVMSYTVSERTHEIGLRMALGTGSDGVFRMIIGEECFRLRSAWALASSEYSR